MKKEKERTQKQLDRELDETLGAVASALLPILFTAFLVGWWVAFGY